MAGARRWVWNWALARRVQHYKDHRHTLSTSRLCEELTILKHQPETTWLQDADSQALQQAIRDLDQAFKRFVEKHARFPKFKSKKRDRLTFRIPQRVKIVDGNVYVPKVGWVRVRQSQPMNGRLTSATFTQDALGHWNVSFATEIEVLDAPVPAVTPAAVRGLDDGLADFVVLDDGTRIAAPRFFRKAETRLRGAQRHLSRCQQGSKRREKARHRVAKIYEKTTNQRRDFVHKTTRRLIHDHRGLCVQALAVRGLARTKLAKSVHDAALGELHRQLQYKTAWSHRHFAVVDRWFPSSKLCSRCGALNDTLTLGDRAWRCACGAVHDRDLNAAINIRTEGLRLLDVAAGHAETANTLVREAVRLSSEGAGLDDARIPRR